MIVPDRRRLIQSLLAAGGLGLLPNTAALAQATTRRGLQDAPRFARNPFSLGIAAGEPAADGFVLWTRLAPEPLAPHGGMPMLPFRVEWQVSADDGFRVVLQEGQAIAHPELGHAVHVEVAGLLPGRRYWYRFMAGGAESMAGTACTLPAGHGIDRVRFAVAGCQHYESGLYTGWRSIAAEQPDFVFHYGDYIYEGAANDAAPLRRHLGQELYSLDDYRLRYAQYKTDPDLQAAHAAAAWFVSFDDHEVDNNWAGLDDQDGTPAAIFALRRAVALQAFYEHMPLRRSSMPAAGGMAMYRRANFGDLLQMHILDTRQYRSDQPCGDGRQSQCEARLSPTRTMLGDAQERWLFNGLTQSRGHWNVIAQQVLMMEIDIQRDAQNSERTYAMDQWAGYMHSRDRLLNHIAATGLTNVAVVSGDAHLHFAGDLRPTGHKGGPVASEFLATSISSGGDGIDDFTTGALWLRNNPDLKAVFAKRGYVMCDVNRERWQTDMKIIDKVSQPDGKVSTAARFIIEHGRPGLVTA